MRLVQPLPALRRHPHRPLAFLHVGPPFSGQLRLLRRDLRVELRNLRLRRGRQLELLSGSRTRLPLVIPIQLLPSLRPALLRRRADVRRRRVQQGVRGGRAAGAFSLDVCRRRLSAVVRVVELALPPPTTAAGGSAALHRVVCGRGRIDPGRATIPLHPPPRLPDDVIPPDLVHQGVEAPRRGPLSRGPKASLQLAHLVERRTPLGGVGSGLAGHALARPCDYAVSTAGALPSGRVLLHGPPQYYRVVCGRGRDPTLSRCPAGVAVQALRFRSRGPARATGLVRRTGRASPCRPCVRGPARP